MFVNSGQLNPYPLYLVLVLDANGATSLHVVEPVCRTLAMVMAGQKGRRERGNSNTDKTRLPLRAADRTIVTSFLVYAASRATLAVIFIIQSHVLCQVKSLLTQRDVRMRMIAIKQRRLC